MMRIRFNPFTDFSIEELELAYIYFTNINDLEAIEMITESFCSQAQLTFEI
jgi:hypothetical protein